MVFEHGYLIGKLGRPRVSAVVKGAIETPNDISGVVYIALDEQGNWKEDLKKEMRSVGYQV
ncbi:putative nucleotide-binding protein containing TIR-like domain protein [compost metagenome]